MTDWYQQAACTTQHPDMFFLRQGCHPKEVAAAKRVCAGCPVQAECLEAGLWEYHGIWGGLTETERRPLRRGRQRPPRPIDHGTNAGYAQHHHRNEPPCRECLIAHSIDRRARRTA